MQPNNEADPSQKLSRKTAGYWSVDLCSKFYEGKVGLLLLGANRATFWEGIIDQNGR